jgi:hypothetical protein
MPVKILKICMIVLALAVASVQAQQSPQERAARLRAQLADQQAQQTDLQARLAQIDEDIKPENIERSFAEIGSTHLEELREARRRQLDIQRKGLRSQLDLLNATRQRLEAAISTAETEGYRQTISPSANSPSNSARRITKHSHYQKYRLKKRRSGR